MDKELKRYYKQRQHGGRGAAARVADGVVLRVVFAAGCYLWFRHNVANEMVVILLTALTTFLFLVAMRLYRQLSFDKFVQKEKERLTDVVLCERLMLLPEEEFFALSRRIVELLPGFENAHLTCIQRASQLGEDDILAAFHAAQKEGAEQMVLISLSNCRDQALALLGRLPVRVELVPIPMLLRMARQLEGYAVTDEDVETHIRSLMGAQRARRERMQAEPFGAKHAKKYLVCAVVLTLSSFITGYALYYRLLAGVCLLLSATSFVLNRPSASGAAEQAQ
ncbi:MAG TPA: hypothetical protein VN366_02310 [Feifaniaceae bacterium]|nr:hypothetical protein [Feifaniaceae bacterium]